MLKMRSRGRVNAQAAQNHQSLPIPHISKILQRQKRQQTLLQDVHCQQSWMLLQAALLLLLRDGQISSTYL